MAIPDDDLDAFERALDVSDGPDVRSLPEFLRQQEVRAAIAFNEAVPEFRTRVALRFTGRAVHGHDLEGHVAGEVVNQFAEAVLQAGVAHGLPGAGLNLYLSPTVRAGSSVLELVGEPVVVDAMTAKTHPIDPEQIPDTPVDAALEELLATLGQLNPDDPEQASLQVDGDFGKRLFKLATTLIDREVDLAIAWQRPRGSVTRADLSRARARTLRDALNKDSVRTESKSARGRVIAMSLKGQFHVQISGQGTVVLVMPEGRREELRALWGQEVIVEYTKTTLSHPNRGDSKPSYELLNVRLVPQTPQQQLIDE